MSATKPWELIETGSGPGPWLRSVFAGLRWYHVAVESGQVRDRYHSDPRYLVTVRGLGYKLDL